MTGMGSEISRIVDELQRGALDVLVPSLPIDAPELETIRLFGRDRLREAGFQ